MLEIFIVMAVIIIILLIAFVIVYKRRKKVEDDINLDDFFEKIEEERMKKVEKEHEEDAKYNFPIKTSSARFIANKSETLKTDFCRNSNRKGISFLGFYEDAIELRTAWNSCAFSIEKYLDEAKNQHSLYKNLIQEEKKQKGNENEIVV